MSRVNSKSPFAVALAGLLDQTELFDRHEWAELLDVTESAISQWVGDKTIPRADHLHRIFVTLRQSSDVPAAPVTTFKAIAHKLATEVSPKHGKRMLPTVWEYMMRPAFSELPSKLAKLSPAEQEAFLEQDFSEAKRFAVPAVPANELVTRGRERSPSAAITFDNSFSTDINVPRNDAQSDDILIFLINIFSSSRDASKRLENVIVSLRRQVVLALIMNEGSQGSISNAVLEQIAQRYSYGERQSLSRVDELTQQLNTLMEENIGCKAVKWQSPPQVLKALQKFGLDVDNTGARTLKKLLEKLRDDDSKTNDVKAQVISMYLDLCEARKASRKESVLRRSLEDSRRDIQNHLTDPDGFAEENSGISKSSVILAHWYLKSLATYAKTSGLVLQVKDGAIEFVKGKFIQWAYEAHDPASEAKIKHLVTETLQGVSRSLTQTLDECNCPELGNEVNEVVERLESAKAFCEEESTWQNIVATLLLSSTPAPEAGPILHYDKAWLFCYLLEEIAKHIYARDFRVSLSIPDSADVVRHWVSGDQLRPSTKKGKSGHLPVPKYHFVGGVVSTLGVPLVDDQPDTDTNSNHKEEGEPDAHLALPLTTLPLNLERAPSHPITANTQGQLVITLLGDRDEFSFGDTRKNLLFYIYANHVQQSLAPGTSLEHWKTWLQPIHTYDELQSEILNRMRHLSRIDIPSPLSRDVWTVVVAQLEMDVSEKVRNLIHSLALARARKKAPQAGRPSTHKIYKLPQEGAYVIFRPDMREGDWLRLRDLGEEHVGPFPIFCAVAWPGEPRRRPAGFVREYSITRPHPYVIESMREEWLSPDRITEQILQQLEFSVAKISELSELRQLYRQSNYTRAMARVIVLLGTRLPGKECLLNDASRLALHHLEFDRARKFADQRIGYMRGELTGHANLLLALLAQGNWKAAQQHIFGEAEGAGCKICKAHPPLESKTVHPNPLLTCCLTLFELTRLVILDRPKIRQKLEKWGISEEALGNAVTAFTSDKLQEKLGDAVTALAPDKNLFELSIINDLIFAAITSEMASLGALEDAKWNMLPEILADKLWRDDDALRRLICATLGIATWLRRDC